MNPLRRRDDAHPLTEDEQASLSDEDLIEYEAYVRMRAWYDANPDAPVRPDWPPLKRDWEGWRPGDPVRNPHPVGRGPQ